MSALAARTGAINLGQGFPDTDGPPEPAGGRRRRDPRRRATSTRRARASRSCARRSPRTSGASTAWTSTRTREVAGHRRRHRGDRRRPARRSSTRATRSSCFEPYYDSYAASDRDGRRRPGARSPLRFAATYALRAEAPARPRSARAPGCSCSTRPHNPTGTVLTARRAGRGRRAAPASTTLLVVTDEVYEHLVFDGAAHVPLATLPGMRERTLTISSAGKTFSSPAGRSAGSRARPSWSTAVRDGQAVPHLRQRRAVPAGGRARRWRLPDDVLRRARRAAAGQRATCCARAGRRRGSRSPARRAPTSSPPTPRRSGTTTAWSSAVALPRRSPAWSACPRRVFHDDAEAGALAGPVRVLQAAGGPRRGRPAASVPDPGPELARRLRSLTRPRARPAAAVPDPAPSSPGGCGP